MGIDKNNFETNSKHDFNIESLRGFAASVVVVAHLIYFSNKFNRGYEFRNSISQWANVGHLMVLVFFMLSGFVIGKNYSNRPTFNSIDYLKKRLIRLYPIYFISILITVVLFKENKLPIVCNLLFLQNLFSNCLNNNQALWSLNHEVLYYLLAILLLKKIISHKVLFFVFLSFLLITFKIVSIPCIIQGYLVGFLFWLSGYALSTFKVVENKSIGTNKLISVFFLLFGCNILNFTSTLTSNFTIPNQVNFFTLDNIIRINDFNLYFYSLYALIIFSSVKFRYIRLLTWFVYLNSLFHLFYIILDKSFFKTDIFYVPTFFLILSILFYFIKPFKITLKPLTYLGTISYAVYVIHTPILFYFSKIAMFSGTTFNFFVRAFIFVGIIFSLSIILEKKLQPYIKRYLLN